ncbi:PIN/TRAM domain-containing protein [Elusimicrobium minutum]|uniref:PIN/TRAM domain-containing protein n=1 Tax=Elusimicrobium minutum TaxID=423605 RepID=UPI0001616DF7|nr:PIN/TRAM domain-containing protein [Elusimicrobium minutum]
MSLWLFRLSALVAFPFLTYNFIQNDKVGLLAGLACAVILIFVEVVFKKLRLIKIMIFLFGGIMGYFVYAFFDHCVFRMNIPDFTYYWDKYEMWVQVALVSIGAIVSVIKSRDLEGLNKIGKHLKVIDITAFIDGRVVDLVDTGFLSGVLVFPKFVLDYLDNLANSKDALERAKGRRGLDVVARLQEQTEVPVRITNKAVDADTEAERIIKLAQGLKAEVVTLDFNVNKMGAIYDVVVLNISDLATALKPVVLPGETMSLFIMKDGKEKDQGVGYLDDGTMVVVEEGRKHVGKRVEVSVYSILQTSAGRMIFAKVK